MRASAPSPAIAAHDADDHRALASEGEARTTRSGISAMSRRASTAGRGSMRCSLQLPGRKAPRHRQQRRRRDAHASRLGKRPGLRRADPRWFALHPLPLSAAHVEQDREGFAIDLHGHSHNDAEAADPAIRRRRRCLQEFAPATLASIRSRRSAPVASAGATAFWGAAACPVRNFRGAPALTVPAAAAKPPSTLARGTAGAPGSTGPAERRACPSGTGAKPKRS